MKILLTIHLIFFSTFLFSQSQYSTEPSLRIRIINSVDTLKIVLNNTWAIIDNKTSLRILNSGEEILIVAENDKLRLSINGNSSFEFNESFILKSLEESGTLRIKNVPFGVGWWWENKEDRIYEGELRFYSKSNDKIEVVAHLSLEQYIKGVVPYEIGNNSPIEALKAQAVAARSEGVMALHSKLFIGNNHDITSDVECQVFSGNKKRTSLSDRAVEETKSIVLSEKGKPINAYYSSNCGGHSELIKNVWGERPGVESYSVSGFDEESFDELDLSDENVLRKWLLSSPSSFCNPNTTSGLPVWSQSNFRWKFDYKSNDINKTTSKGKSYGNLLDIKILQRGESGRATKAKFIFETEIVEITGELKIRQMFAPPLRSACFIVDKKDSGFTLYGAGWGHGVGMCQSGAIGMANSGKNFEEILKHYYRKAEILKIY